MNSANVSQLRTVLEMIKFEHTLFALPLIYAGALLAEPPLTLWTGVLILIAATGARTTALGLNRILDRRLDAQNPRTAGRERRFGLAVGPHPPRSPCPSP